MTIAWVVGAGGLLGSALGRALASAGTEIYSPAERFRWGSPPSLGDQLRRAVRGFSERAGAAHTWEIYWAAGVGSMGSADEALAAESRALSQLLTEVAVDPGLGSRPGAVALASSAGAIYAGSSDDVISEETPPAPTTAYARAKLEQEEQIRAFVEARDGATAFVARLSTLYGPGQAHGKRQGLIAHIARSMLRNRPIQIFVPLDTVRDYLHADDAAASMVSGLRSAAPAFRQRRVETRIVASEQPTTIAEILGIFRKVARRAPRIVTCSSRLSALYPRHVRFRSLAVAQRRPARVPIFTGICTLMSFERAAFARVGAAGRG